MIASVCSVCGGDLRLKHETLDRTDMVYVGSLECPDCGRTYVDSRKLTEQRKGASMAKRAKSKPNGKAAPEKPARGRKPRQPSLPGTGAVRSEKLDALCEGIGEERGKINDATTEINALIAAALKVMQSKKINVYRHAKVELSRVPGAEKLRVRLTKEEGDAGEDDLETGDEASDATAGAEA